MKDNKGNEGHSESAKRCEIRESAAIKFDQKIISKIQKICDTVLSNFRVDFERIINSERERDPSSDCASEKREKKK